MALSLDGFLKVGVDILSSVLNRTTGKILFQTGSVTEQTADAQNVEHWQQVCWASRPSNPQPGKKAAQGVVLSAGDHDICIASQDVRCLEQYGNLDAGEFCAFAPGPDTTAQGRVIGKKDGSVTMFTTHDNTKAGKSVYWRVKKDGFIGVGPWGTIKFDYSGLHVVHASGAELHLGGIYGLPDPISALTTYFKVKAASARMESSGAPIADATAVAAAIAALQAEILALQIALTAVGAAPGPVQGEAVKSAAAASAVVIATSATTLGVQTPLIPKSSTAT